MSDVIGEGYGSSHDWRNDLTDRFMYRGQPEKGTRYICRACGETFVHPYDIHPGIFEAMEIRGITDPCPATIGANGEGKNRRS